MSSTRHFQSFFSNFHYICRVIKAFDAVWSNHVVITCLIHMSENNTVTHRQDLDYHLKRNQEKDCLGDIKKLKVYGLKLAQHLRANYNHLWFTLDCKHQGLGLTPYMVQDPIPGLVKMSHIMHAPVGRRCYMCAYSGLEEQDTQRHQNLHKDR